MQRYHLRFDPQGQDGETIATLRRLAGSGGLNGAILATLRLGLPLFREEFLQRADAAGAPSAALAVPARAPAAPGPSPSTGAPALTSSPAPETIQAGLSMRVPAIPTLPPGGAAEREGDLVADQPRLSEATRKLLTQYD